MVRNVPLNASRERNGSARPPTQKDGTLPDGVDAAPDIRCPRQPPLTPHHRACCQPRPSTGKAGDSEFDLFRSSVWRAGAGGGRRLTPPGRSREASSGSAKAMKLQSGPPVRSPTMPALASSSTERCHRPSGSTTARACWWWCGY